MAVIDYADPAELSSETRETLKQVPGKVNSVMMLAHAESCLGAMFALGRGMRQTRLDQRLKQIAILHTAKLEDAPYPWSHNVDISRRIGVPDWQIRAIDEGRVDDPAFSELETLALRFTGELVSKGAASPGTVRAMAAASSEREVVELILAITYHIMLGRLTKTLQVDVDEAPNMPHTQA